jgi:hypothetical protein
MLTLSVCAKCVRPVLRGVRAGLQCMKLSYSECGLSDSVYRLSYSVCGLSYRRAGCPSVFRLSYSAWDCPKGVRAVLHCVQAVLQCVQTVLHCV